MFSYLISAADFILVRAPLPHLMEMWVVTGRAWRGIARVTLISKSPGVFTASDPSPDEDEMNKHTYKTTYWDAYAVFLFYSLSHCGL